MNVPASDGQLLFDLIVENGYKNAVYIPDKSRILSYLSNTMEEGDVMLFMGAGDISAVAEKLTDKYEFTNQYRYLAHSDPGKMIFEQEERNVKVFLLPTPKDNSFKHEKPNPWYVEGKKIHTDFATFVDISKILYKSIKEWLKKYEVDDLNF